MRLSVRYLFVGTVPVLAACVGSHQPPTATEATVVADSTNVDEITSVAEIVVQNPSRFARQDEAIVLSLYDLGLAADSPRLAALQVSQGGKPVHSQLVDQDGNGQPDQLLWLTQLAPAEQQQFRIAFGSSAASTETGANKRTQADLSHKIDGQWQDKKYLGGRFQSVTALTPPPQYTDHSEYIRYEGPGLESDQVGFRVYLDWRNGFDIFGKKTAAPVLHTVGHDGYSSYHQMADWGMDVLKVGKSLGSGGFGYWDGKQVHGVAQVQTRSARITANGDLHSALTIDYQDWQVAGKRGNASAALSMTAGSRLLRNQLKLDRQLDSIAIGFVKLPDTKLLRGKLDIPGHSWTYLASYGKQSLSGDDLGIAVFFKLGPNKQITEDEHSQLIVLDASSGEVEYYVAAAWQQEPGGIQNEVAFVQYLNETAERLTMPARVQIYSQRSAHDQQAALNAASALLWGKRLADSELTRQTPEYRYGGWDFERKRPTTFEYTTGLLLQAYDDLYRASQDARYRTAVLNTADSFVSDAGVIHTYDAGKFNIDSINSGNLLLRAWDLTGDDKYRRATASLRAQLQHHPRTREGAFWHKQIYPHQLWLDGVYMGMPFLADYSRRFEQGASWPEVVKEFTITRQRLRDPVTGLYFHGWDEAKQQSWADKTTGLSSQFWARGTGWLAMALVDVLDQIPSGDACNDALRKPLLDMVSELAESLARYQDPTSGVWYQILDKPNEVGNYREASASSMFVYFYAKAINRGYLPTKYRTQAEAGFRGLLREFVVSHPDNRISLRGICQVAGLGFGRDGSYDYYQHEPIIANDAKGTGPFIMASVQMAMLLGS